MKKMFLASSFADVADLFVKFTDGKCEGKTITFIPTASLPEEVKFYVAAGKEALKKRGLVVDELDISTATKEEIVGKLQGNDYIYVTGGNTFFLLQELRRTGADKIIAEQINSGKPYVGESAGSIVLSRNIEYVKDMDNIIAAPNLDSFSSLGLVNFYPLPHHTNFPFKEAVENIISNYAGKIELCPISNTQAIIINEGEFEVWSK
jgi:dipeptidase E